MNIPILLVEDEIELATSIKLALKKMNLVADHSLNLEQARERLTETDYKLVIIDRMLPDGDGIDLCRELRGSQFMGGLLLLTAKGTTEDRVEGLEAGADDYLPKPFSWQEFEARLKSVLRRAHPVAQQGKAWVLNPDTHAVLGPKGWVTLTKLEFHMASKLIETPGTVFSRDDLLKEVWGYRFLPETRTVDFFVGRLRKKFEKDHQNPKHFVTVRGVGYRFCP